MTTLPRPSETIQATISALIGAALIIYGAVKNGFDFEDVTNPEVQGAVMLVVGFVATLVTWYVARRQRDRELGSANDGAVLPAPPPP
jgi:hypothetical protein